MNSNSPDSATWPDATGSTQPGARRGRGGPGIPPREPGEPVAPVEIRRRWRVPLLLFVPTCMSTFFVGGPAYAISLMTILFCHEMGHFLQAKRYGVPASLPFFIPVPIPPIGTMGAVIGMSLEHGQPPGAVRHRHHRPVGRARPDDDLPGRRPALVRSGRRTARPDAVPFGEPLLLRFLVWLKFGPCPRGWTSSCIRWRLPAGSGC